METVALLYEDYQKELAEDFKNTFLKRASDTDSSRSNDTVIDEVTDMLSTNIAVYTEKLLQRWGFSSGGEGGGGGDVTVTLDDLLKKYLSDNYVTIKGDQEVFGEKDFRKGIRIAGRRLYWDEGNDALVIEGAAYTTRWLSAKGVSPGGGGAGSGGAAAMYQLIDVSPNDTKDAVLGAEKDYVLTFDGSFWRGMPNKGGLSSKLFTALDKEGHEINPDDENAEIYAIRANYSLWSVGFLSAKGISDGGTGGGGGGAVALYQLLDVEKNADITGVAGATKGSVLTFNGDKWYADKPKTAAGISNLFTALDKDGNDVDLNDESKLSTITNIRANYALWSVDWISAKGKSSGGSGGGGGLINLVYGFESLGGTFDNNDNSATFNAFTINEIWKLASSGLTNVTVTGSGNAVTDVTKGSDGRSLTFTKGSTFATKSEFDALNTKFNDFLTGSDADDIINKWSELEVFLQGMKESDNLAVILQSKMDKTAFSKLFTALDASGNEVDPSDDTKTIASIRANFGFWGVDYISAKGVSNGSGGTGGASALYQLVDVLANDTEDGVEGAAAGKALVFDGTHWKAGDAGLNESQLYAYLTANRYLTQSAADSRYVTSSRKVIAGTGLSGGGALTSDITLSLGISGVVAGTYTKVIVDAYGRVTSGTNLSATDIPNLDWSKITTGKPTTLAGYGITDAVTLTTNQTISGQKTFTKNILMNSGIGLSYSGNTVFRNTSGNTVISSYGSEGIIYFRPNGDTSDVGVIQINKQGHLNGVSAGFTGDVSAARLTANEYIQIGDAYLKWDAANNAVYVIKKDGTTPVGFYSTDWLSAKGLSMSGTQTGTLDSLNDVEITDPTNGQALKYDAVSKKWVNGTIDSFNVNQMWAELKKADSSKIIDASHIPTSVLDGRWVKKAGDTMTGTLTSVSSSGSIVFKGVENCDITNIYKDNGVIKNDDGGLISIRNGLRFNWYDTYWYIGNLRGSSTDSAGFGIVDHNNKLVLRVTPNDVRAPRFMSTVATGLSPLIVSSNTTVDNLSADLLDGYHAFGTSNAIIKYGHTVGGTEPAWCRIATYSIRNAETMTDVCFVLHSSFSDLFGLLVVRTRGMEYVQGELMVAYNINTSNIRIYHDAEMKNIELYCYGGSNYSIIQANLLYSHDRNGGHNTAITLYRSDTKAPSWSTYVNPVFANLQNSSEAAKKLQTPRTLWGQSFDGTANVSGDMTGVGNITMSGDLKIGNGTSPNTIYFYGTTGDGPGGYNHTFIAERLWGGTESSELVLFKGNDIGNGNEAVNVSNSGPDRIRHIAAAHLFQTYTSSLAGSVEDVCTSSALKSLFGIAANRVTSYVPFMSTVASGTAPFIVVSNTVVGNLNADLLDGVHLAGFGGREGVMRSWLRGRYTTVNQYFGNGNVVTIDPKPTDDATLSTNTTVLSLGDVPTRNTQLAFYYDSDTIKYRRHDDSKWNDWVVLIHSGNYASYSDGRYVKKAGDTMTGNLNISGGHILYMLQTSPTSTQQIHLQGGSNDYGRIAFGATAENAGWMEIASCDDGNEPIYARQYTGVFTTIKRTATLLDASGNTSFPGSVTSVRHISTVGTGTQPYQCNSTTLNTNLNADLLDGQHGAYYQNRMYDGFVSQHQAYDYIEFLRFVIPTGQQQLKVYVIFDLCRVETGGGMSGRAVLRIRRDGDNNAGYIFYVTNFGQSWLPELRCTTDDGITWRVWMKCVKDSYDPYIAIKIVEQYPYGYVTTQNNGTTGTPGGSKYTVVAGIAGLSNAANIWTNARMFYIQDHNAAHTGAGVSVNGSSNVYLKLPSSIQCSDWFRSTGNSGWYHQDYGGGIYMQDSTYIRNYGSKRLRIQTDTYDTLQLVRTSGSGGSSIAFYNGGGTFRGQLGVNASSWFSFDTGTATANQNVVEISPAGGIHSKAEITAKASGSDIRLKKDIQNYNAMNIINRFRSVKYHWNDIAKANSEVYNNDYDQFGLIAQDLIAGGFEQWVRDVFHDYYTVTYERLIPVVWKGLQEVDDEVTKLKREVARLNKRVKELEKSLCA